MIELTESDILKYEKINEERVREYNINSSYVLGKNPTIFEDPTKKTPDNRIPIPLAKSAVEDMTGYAGSTGAITIDWGGEVNETTADTTTREEYIALNKEIYKYNEAELETTELYNQALTQGEAYELFWVSDDLTLSNGILTPEFALIDNTEMILVYDQSIKPKLNAAIRFWQTGEIKYADVYYPKYKEGFKRLKDSLSWSRNIDADAVYPYKNVPVAVYKINRTSQPLFESEKEMIDAHDNLISKSVNEIDRYNALLALFPDKVDAEFIRKLEEFKIVDDLGEFEKWPEYLSKDLSGVKEFYNELADRLERLYHKTIKVPDFSDENFAGNSSGVALAYKLMGLEFKAAQIEAYFSKGLLQRNTLINDVINSSKTKTFDKYIVTIDCKRNLPVDESSKIDGAEKLSTLVSKETVLKYLPNTIVDDVKLEMERMDEELMSGIIVAPATAENEDE